ncbi:hypothetical protein EAG_04422 [Camponotus floridanus]|uniref:Uncharacterized protein n=1 Tax=Camponotus floridanus TaxID=104421 RepID=E2AFS3_CAMFO|nr:hypothetical protein EAG_04422 [Camponotus floridanus]
MPPVSECHWLTDPQVECHWFTDPQVERRCGNFPSLRSVPAVDGIGSQSSFPWSFARLRRITGTLIPDGPLRYSIVSVVILTGVGFLEMLTGDDLGVLAAGEVVPAGFKVTLSPS